MSTKHRAGPGPEARSDDTLDLRGEIIDGRYRIVEVLGEGGMGRVYLAEQTRLRRSVAVKVLQRAYSNAPEVGRRFELEALAVARLDHPNCVAVQDFGRLPDGSLYLVMSYLSGVLLRAPMLAGRFAPARALHVARHLLSGLAHAHHAGIIHRDVKPENVMLVRHEGDPDFAKLFDFGIAKLVEGEPGSAENLTVAGQRFGTPTYMSPEQALGKPLDPRTDLYSLTVVLYEMLTGQAPFKAEDGAGVMVLHAAKAPPTLAEGAKGERFASALEELVRRGLAKNPDHRHASAAEYLARLDEARRELDAPIPTVRARPSPPKRRPRAAAALLLRLVRSRRVLAALAIGFTLAVVGFELYRASRVDHAARARQLLADGRPRDASAYLEEHFKQIADDAPAQLELGHAYAALRRYEEALLAYERVRSLERRLADDRTMRTNLMLMLDDERGDTPGRAARFLIQILGDAAARDRLVEMASRHPSPARRAAMRELAESLGLSNRIDRISSYQLDLDQGATCQDRRQAVAKLRALGDPAAGPALERARARKTNACLREDAADALRYLETLGAIDGLQE